MGELKEIRDQQDNLIQRAKTLGNKLYLAGLGVQQSRYSSEELYARGAGQEAYGDEAKSKSRPAGESRLVVALANCLTKHRKSATSCTSGSSPAASRSAARKPRKPTNTCSPAWAP